MSLNYLANNHSVNCASGIAGTGEDQTQFVCASRKITGMVPSFLEKNIRCFLIQCGNQVVIQVNIQLAVRASAGVEQAE